MSKGLRGWVILLSVSGVILTSFITLVVVVNKETRYCGKVVKCYMTSAGYKVHPKRFVVFYNDSLKRNIDVKVNRQTYANTTKGQNVCFNLNNKQLNN